MKRLNSRVKFITFFIGTLSLFFVTVLPVIAQAQLTEQSKLYIDGIGPVLVGMTVPEASRAAGRPLVSTGDSGGGSNCFYLTPEGGPRDVGFMIADGRISRIDIWRESRITTLSGAGIGDTEARIKALYPGKIQVSPHKYVQGGHYLTFVPQDRSDSNYRLVFETDGNRVTQFRVGKLPEVEFVEGCA
ncbi:MAG: hypothetical protein KME26_27715 [Oscillatoria princeps RMCB-10]|jgi:hypothetical protein|nr:hypothetical protein [Oscillatoria princeps RMCB-10]